MELPPLETQRRFREAFGTEVAYYWTNDGFDYARFTQDNVGDVALPDLVPVILIADGIEAAHALASIALHELDNLTPETSEWLYAELLNLQANIATYRQAMNFRLN